MSKIENEFQKEINDLKEAYFNLLSSLFRLSEAISFKTSLKDTFALSLELLHVSKKYEYGAVFLKQGEDYHLTHFKGDLSLENKARDTSLELFPWVQSGQKKVSVMPDFSENGVENGSIVLIPLLFQETVLGIIMLISKESAENYVKQDQELFTIIGYQTAVAVNNSMLYKTMEEKNLELVHLKNYLENILENMESGIMVVNLDFKITTFNRSAEKIFRVCSADVENSDYLSVFHSCCHDSVKRVMRNTLDLGTSSSGEIELKKTDSSSHPFEMSITPLKIQSAVTGYIITLRDLSQTREIERLKELDRMKTELVSNVSHELRTPLTSIKAYAETLLGMVESGERDQPTEQEFLGIINNEAERLTSLITELLTMSQLESNKVKLKIEEFDAGDLIRECVAIVREVIRKKNISCRLAFRQKITIRSDREKVKQILVNLIGNAVKYNKDSGKIKIVLSRKGTQCWFRIIDSGIGIPAESLSKVFERFYRVDSSLTYEISGTGLGLAICQELCGICGGEIFVLSRLGCGSVFKFYLPVE